jgi:hypothetical protein
MTAPPDSVNVMVGFTVVDPTPKINRSPAVTAIAVPGDVVAPRSV